jgi:ABC-type lipoprotein release transport system permease subunit
MNIVRMAARGVLRKPRRLLVTTSALGLACALAIFFGGLSEGLYSTLVGGVIDGECGHLQAHARRWRADPNLYAVIATEPSTLDALGFAWTPRLGGFGLATNNDRSAGVEIRGLDLLREPRVSILGRRMLRGRWLAADDPTGVVLGRRLAVKLGASIGDRLVLLAQAADGSPANEFVVVRGILDTVSVRTDEATLFVGETFFRNFFEMPKGWHEIAVRLPEGGPPLERARLKVAAAVPGAEVATWKELNPVLATCAAIQKAVLSLFLFVAFLAVGLAVGNAILLGVYGRFHEFGIMKSLGMGPGKLAGLIVLEALFEALIADAAALVAGPLMVRLLSRHPLDLTGLLRGGVHVGGLAFDPVVTAHMSWGILVVPLVLTPAVAVAAALYPAFKAAALSPLAALHHR